MLIKEEKRPDNFLERKISLFKNKFQTEKPQYITINELIKTIKTGGNNQRIIDELRAKQYKSKDVLKSQLEGVTVSSYCNHRVNIEDNVIEINFNLTNYDTYIEKCKKKTRYNKIPDSKETLQYKINNLLELQKETKLIYHTGLIQIDIDYIEEQQKKKLKNLKKQLMNDEFSFLVCISPSGDGLKVLVKIDESKHLNSLNELVKYYKKKYDIIIDESTKDIFRLMFVSYDNECYLNENSKIFDENCFLPNEKTFEVSANLHKPKKEKITVNVDSNSDFEDLKLKQISNIKYILSQVKQGEKHDTRRNLSRLIGGLVGGGIINKSDIWEVFVNISDSVSCNGVTSFGESKTLDDGFNNGLKKPISIEDFIEKMNKYHKFKRFDIDKETSDIKETYYLNISIPQKIKEKDNFGNIIEVKRFFTYNYDIPESLKESFELTNHETGELTKIDLPFCFWYEKQTKKDGFSLFIDSSKFYTFLDEIGFSKLIYDVSSKESLLIHKIGKIIIDVDTSFIINYIYHTVFEVLPFHISSNFTIDSLKNKFLTGLNSYLNDVKLNILKRNVLNFLHDSANVSYHFFSNGFVEITKDQTILKTYDMLPDHIWRTQIKEHNISINSDESAFNNSNFYKWSKNINSKRITTNEELESQEHCIDMVQHFKMDEDMEIILNQLNSIDSNFYTPKDFPKELANFYKEEKELFEMYLAYKNENFIIDSNFEEERFKRWKWCTGRMLHNYKTSSNRKAIILTESYVGEKPQGRTGKGLTIKAISKLRNVLILDGKNINFNSSFAFQNVKPDTDLIYIDDVIGGFKGRNESKNFNFETLYSAISEGVSYEGKFKERVNMTPEESPNFIISTNYSISGDSESNKGRKIDLELHNYYDSYLTPDKHFKGYFFDNWNNDEWNMFYNYMFNCVAFYLQDSKIIPFLDSESIKEKNLVNNTSLDYSNFLKEKKDLIGNIIKKNNFKIEFLNYIDVSDIEEQKTHWLKSQLITKWLKNYAEIYNYKYEDKTVNNERCFILNEK